MLLAVGVPLPAALPEQDGLAQAADAVNLASVPQRLRFPEITIRRDPFLATGVATEGGAAVGDRNGGGIVLPPNAAASTPVLRAVILGSVPKALVEIAGRSAIVGIGSPLADSTVVEISPTSLLLEDGVMLALPGNQP
jgi:hypothetical protein